MPDLKDIEKLAKAHADARDALARSVTTLEDELRTARRARRAELLRLSAKAGETHTALAAAIRGEPGLFAKPRTRLFHGIRVGLQKGKGKISYNDDEQVVKLIRRHVPDQFDSLVKVTEKPVKDALSRLAADLLKKLGCTVGATGDQVVIKPVDSEIDKLVDAMVAAASADDEDEEQAA